LKRGKTETGRKRGKKREERDRARTLRFFSLADQVERKKKKNKGAERREGRGKGKRREETSCAGLTFLIPISVLRGEERRKKKEGGKDSIS